MLLDISLETLTDLTERGILAEGEAPGTYRLGPNVRQYCQHLRDFSHSREESVAAGKTPQANYSDAPIMKPRSEQVPVAEAEIGWGAKLRRPSFLTGKIIGAGISSFRIYVIHGRSYTVFDA